jgi:hypothetical protein
LTKLYLSRNMIGVEGAKLIAKALEKNTTLVTLDLSLNKFNQDAETVALLTKAWNKRSEKLLI